MVLPTNDELLIRDGFWPTLEPFFDRRRGGKGRPHINLRMTVEGIVWVGFNKARWKDMPQRFGELNSVYRQYFRWQQDGIWLRVLSALASLAFKSSKYTPWYREVIGPHPHYHMKACVESPRAIELAIYSYFEELEDAPDMLWHTYLFAYVMAIPRKAPKGLNGHREVEHYDVPALTLKPHPEDWSKWRDSFRHRY